MTILAKEGADTSRRSMFYIWLLLAVAQAASSSPCRLADPSIEAYKTLSERQQVELVDSHRAKFGSAFRQIDEVLRSVTRSTPFLVEGRLKSTASFREKLQRPGKHYKCFSEITDVAGLRIIVPDYAALPYVIDAIRDHFEVVEEQHRINDVGDDGYRAVHFLVTVEDRIAEIQIQTLRGSLWANASHVLYYKGPFRGSDALQAHLVQLSQAIYLLDSGIHASLPPLPPALPAAAGVVLEHVYTQIAKVERLHPLEPFFLAPASRESQEAPLARSEEASLAPRELRRLERGVLDAAGIEADDALLEAALAAEHYALDDFGSLRYRWQAESAPPPVER